MNSGGPGRLDEGVATLTTHLEELAGSRLEELCDGLLRRMLRGIPRDYVALVAVRLGDDEPDESRTTTIHG